MWKWHSNGAMEDAVNSFVLLFGTLLSTKNVFFLPYFSFDNVL